MVEEVRQIRSKLLELIALCDAVLAKQEGSKAQASQGKPDEGEVIAYIRERIEGAFGDFPASTELLRSIAKEVDSWEVLTRTLNRMVSRAEKGWKPENPYPYLLVVLRRQKGAAKPPSVAAEDLVQEVVSAALELTNAPSQ